MERVMEGIKVLEVSAWAFVPSAGAVLADWGADVIKVEPPEGDPMRGLVSSGITGGVSFPWEMWNRGKRSVAVDLNNDEGRELVLKLAEQADVFLTSYLPHTRQKLGIDIDAVQARNPAIIYACGSGFGPLGDEADKGGYDAISFWARGGLCSATTPPGASRPIAQPTGALGDSLSGMALAGGIAAALLRRTRTGEGAVVDVSLLNTAMWCMQMSIVGASMMATMAANAAKEEEKPNATPAGQPQLYNPLVNNYKTSDDRWIMLCMLQRDKFWAGFCTAIGRSDLLTDERFATSDALSEHLGDAIKEIEATFASLSLAELKAALATQDGQWDVVTNVFELAVDPQAMANGYVQSVGYDGGIELPLIASPAQFDRTPPALGTAPDFNAHAEDVLGALGMDEEAIIQAKISGAVV